MYRLDEDPFCAALATALEARPMQWSTLRDPLPNHADHARHVLPNATDCSLWGMPDTIRYGCMMVDTAQGASPSDVVGSFVVLDLTLKGCLGVAGQAQPATSWLRQIAWPGVDLLYYQQNGHVWTQVNLTTPNPYRTTL